MTYLLPALFLSVLSIIVLLASTSDFSSPEDHYLKHPGEFAILASNLSASFTVITFWFLFIFSIKSWSIPSFYALQGGIVIAYGVYGVLVWKDIRHKTFLHFIFGPSPPTVIRWLFFGLAFSSIIVELGLGRAFIEKIAVAGAQPVSLAALSVLILGATTILYTYSGGMFAVLRADAIFVSLCVLLIGASWVSAGPFAWSTGFLRDLHFYDMRALTFLDYCFYVSAGLYVALMFLFHPDHWYRNLRLSYKSKRTRLLTIAFSALTTSMLLQVAYFIAVASRTSLDYALLNNNLVRKTYDLNSVIEVVIPFFPFSWGQIALVFMVLVSAFTTINSLIISSVAGFYETRPDANPSRYQAILYEFFRLTVILTIGSLIVGAEKWIFVALVIGGAQLSLTTSLTMGRVLLLSSASFIFTVFGSLAVFFVTVVLNLVLQLHWYYPFLAIMSAIVVSVMVWSIAIWRAKYGNE